MASRLVSFALAALIAICLFEIAKSEGNRKHQTFRAKVYTEKVVAHKRKNSPVKRGGGSSSKTRSTKKSRDGRVRSISTSHSSIFFYERTKNIKKATAKKAGMEKEVVQKKANAKNAAKKPVAKEPEPEGDGEAKTMANNNGKVRQKVCLIVIDGWGLAYEKKGNAIANAKTPVMDELCFGNWQQLEAHGLHVGLEPELMGNSEVGHLNIGAGRVVYQDIVRINLAVQKNKLVSNEQVIAAAERAKKGNGRLHLLGLVSDGGVHSHIEHLFGLIRAFKQLQVPHLYIHFFGDGRDTSPTSGVGYLKQLLDFITAQKYGELGTIIGRYYAMDRDKRWERIKIAYEALIGGIVPEGGEKTTVDRAIEAVKARYEQNPSETDEFLKPIVFSDEARVNDNDTLVFFNYRADRMRQINECMGLEKYKDLQSSVPHPQNIQLFGMTQYNKEFPFPILFPPVSHKNVLAEWLSSQGVSQFHCAETEKYAHVTFFFNGGREVQFEGEERSMVPSPKVPTYDLQPEMSASGVADKMVEQIQLGKHPFVMCNFAPPDMVGHTGQYEPAVKACEATDQAIGRIYEACKKHGYVLMVTADHGNAEKMVAVDGGKHTAHTCNLVPFTCSSQQFVFKKDPPIGEDGQPRARALRDVAPSVLFLLGLPTPPEMDGVNLLEEYK